MRECHPGRCELDPHGTLNTQHSPGAVGCVLFAGFIFPWEGNAVWHHANSQGAVSDFAGEPTADQQRWGGLEMCKVNL